VGGVPKRRRGLKLQQPHFLNNVIQDEHNYHNKVIIVHRCLRSPGSTMEQHVLDTNA